MSEATESNINEMMAGDGSGLALPPAFVFVNTKSHRKYKKNNDKVDGRTKGAKTMLSRINKRKMKKEELEVKVEPIQEKAPTETERAQKQIHQMKKLKRSKGLQKKRAEAKKGMQDKSDEMNVLMRARMSDFKKKASDQTKKAGSTTQKNSYEPTEGEIMVENTATYDDVIKVAMEVATSELNPAGEHGFAKIKFDDGTEQNLDNFSAKRIAACYGQLDDTHKNQFQYLLNKDASTYQSALDFAIRSSSK
tara:strand:- start:372 stop:1121 length:750 start_codon:yes stop_codon:yes gene_type:complete